jgi:hypothetical protein
MDAMQKMFQRGWTDDTTGDFVLGHEQALSYCWVVEIPENEKGERNPHVHILIDWQVDFKYFDAWSSRLESIWGNGYFHLEKIHDPLCAGAYMAKAAGYMTKANGQNDQGEVVGNRYGISKRARAPEWYTIGEYELGLMGGIIRDLFNAVEKKHGDKFAKRRQLNQQRHELIALETKEKKKTGKPIYWAKAKREKIGIELAKVRAQIAAMPVRASKYQTVLKVDMLPWFLGRALGMGWKPNKRPDSQELAKFKRVQHRRQRRREAATDRQIVDILDQTQDRKEETLAASAEFFDKAAKGWCFLNQDDWRSNYGSV